ncbi:MAG: hypothetical protein V5A64_05835 [Candidatus Thermoplasmatota archaeon]
MSQIVGRRFSKNMLIMLVAIMVGVIVITFFVADLMRRQASEEKIESLNEEITTKEKEIVDVKKRNINFTNHFLKSLGVLDKARGDRADGNYNFDVAFLWYNTALSATNSSKLETYKNVTISNCEKAMVNYSVSSKNFELASQFFNKTTNYTVYDGYIELLDLYMNLTGSGVKLTNARYNTSLYLKYLAENLTIENNTVGYLTNVSDLQEAFNESMMMYSEMLGMYSEQLEMIEEYDIEGFSTKR